MSLPRKAVGAGLATLVVLSSYSGLRWLSQRYPIPGVTSFAPPPKRYNFGQELNKSKTGSAISCSVWPDDDFYLFVRDFKRSGSKPIFLCYMNYTSTQGSYRALWSKDRMMLAVVDGSAAMFPADHLAQWVIGYEWGKGRVLFPSEIDRVLFRHGGRGEWMESAQPLRVSTAELKQFEPETLSRSKIRRIR